MFCCENHWRYFLDSWHLSPQYFSWFVYLFLLLLVWFVSLFVFLLLDWEKPCFPLHVYFYSSMSPFFLTCFFVFTHLSHYLFLSPSYFSCFLPSFLPSLLLSSFTFRLSLLFPCFFCFGFIGWFLFFCCISRITSNTKRFPILSFWFPVSFCLSNHFLIVSYHKFCFFCWAWMFYDSPKRDVINNNIGMTIIIRGEEELSEERHLIKKNQKRKNNNNNNN